MDIDKISRLKIRVELTFGTALKTPKDFERLSESVFSRTGVLLSATTLKRIWGYIDEPVTPRSTTLDVMARYAGWENWEEFLHSESPNVESGLVAADKIDVAHQLRRGDRIRLTWLPGRVCDVEYMGDAEFRILATEATKLKPGQTFTCHLIVAGEPLYLENLSSSAPNPIVGHPSLRTSTYVCGSRHGILFIRQNQ